MPNKVLVVDDSPDVRLVCRVNLEYHGYDVAEAQTGAEALQIVNEQRPDIILLDVMMPQMDGWEMLSTLKSDPTTADIPVVMLTARTRETDQIRGWRAGASDYIIKPFNPEVLIPSVRAALERGDVDGHRRERVDMLRFAQKLLADRSGDRQGTSA